LIGSVLEATEDQSQLLLELQDKINVRLQGVVADQKEVLAALFDEIDTDGSGAINRFEFRNMLQALHLHYRCPIIISSLHSLLCSDEKFKRLFKAVDRNKDGTISIEELYTILFPEKAEKEDIQVGPSSLPSSFCFSENNSRNGVSESKSTWKIDANHRRFIMRK
jgi:hypothetical protein